MTVEVENAMAIRIDLTPEETALLSQAASRSAVSINDLIKAYVLSSCEGVNTPTPSKSQSSGPRVA